MQPQKHSVLDVLVVRQSETVSGIITGTAISFVTGKVFTGEVQASDGQGGTSAMYDTVSAVCGVVWVAIGYAAGTADPIVGAGAALIGVFVCIGLNSGGSSSGGTIGHSNALTP